MEASLLATTWWEDPKLWISLVALALGIWNFVVNRRHERRTMEMERRGDAPHFVINWHPFDLKILEAWADATPETVLTVNNSEFSRNTFLEGTKVFFPVRNIGKQPRELIARLDGEKIGFMDHSEFNKLRGGAEGPPFWCFHYKLVPSKIGESQELVIEFETDTGRRDRHVYGMLHGKFFICRKEPKELWTWK